ncbi:MAG TPA: hypothetical protein PLB87_12810, partial [Prolixibacteraceae bacterium]|nr:hypothetical protein [Prolixibacteraceae bacterium]
VWKIAIEHASYQKKIVGELCRSYYENENPHSNLIKQDVIVSLKQIFLYSGDNGIRSKIDELIDSENDGKLIKSLKKLLN